MDATVLASVAGVILALGFAYIPGLNEWYAKQTAQAKALVMLGLLAAVAGGAYGLACAGLAGDFDIGVTCDKAGGIALLKAFLAALAANQATYLIAPQTQKVRDAKTAG
jgi:hypothetical protein